MKKYLSKHRILFVIIVFLAILLSLGLGYQKFYAQEVLRQELNLDGLFVNIQGVEIKTEGNVWGEKPYKEIRIKIPSLASKGDDTLKEGDSKINQIINREALDEGVTKWLKNVFNKKEAKKYSVHIEVWYRDDKIVDE